MGKQLSCCNFSETDRKIYCIGKIIPLQSCKIVDRIYPTARLFYSLLSTNVLHTFAQVLLYIIKIESHPLYPISFNPIPTGHVTTASRNRVN